MWLILDGVMVATLKLVVSGEEQNFLIDKGSK